MASIVVDDREHAVLPFMEDLSHDFHIDYKTAHMTVGDYAITYNGNILIIIERKTWVDLAASLRDGRKANLQKLLDLRDATGCQVAYLIEGNPCPRKDKKFSHVPYKNLRSHLDHVAFRDGVHMVYALDQADSAYRLFELTRNYISIKPSMLGGAEDKPAIDKPSGVDVTVSDTAINTPVIDNIPAIDKPTVTDKPQLSELSLLTSKKDTPVTSIGIQEKLLRCLPGIGSVISTMLAESGITLVDIRNGTYAPEHISRLKYTTGASIGLDKAQKIYDNKKIFTSSSVLASKVCKNILSSVTGVSEASASRILTTHSLDSILSKSTTAEQLADAYRTDKTKVGINLATKIIQTLIG